MALGVTAVTGLRYGAPVHQLPVIFKELVDAGMESGQAHQLESLESREGGLSVPCDDLAGLWQAYGKSLRTVKSCVGSTWCRYGQQDAVTMAVTLEDRYKGLRSPHKLRKGL